MKAFAIVEEFEKKIAKFAGAKHGIAVNTGTSAIFLSMQYRNLTTTYRGAVTIPAHTFISVPMAAIQCGFKLEFDATPWDGAYEISPLGIIDGALRFCRGMYEGGLHCLSFQARKLLNIGEGGMILTDDDDAVKWLRKARYSGREAPYYRIEDVDMLGIQAYMTPEKAARGLHLLEYIADDLPDQKMKYVDLRKVKVFDGYLSERCNLRAA